MGVTVWPTEAYTKDNYFGGVLCLAIHLAGAGMMFVGYLIAEFTCMEMCGFTHKEALQLSAERRAESGKLKEEWSHRKFLSIEGHERVLRQCTVSCMALFFFLFIVFQ